MVDTLFFQNGSIQYKGSFRGGTIHGYGVHYYQGQVLFTPHHALLKSSVMRVQVVHPHPSGCS